MNVIRTRTRNSGRTSPTASMSSLGKQSSQNAWGQVWQLQRGSWSAHKFLEELRRGGRTGKEVHQLLGLSENKRCIHVGCSRTTWTKGRGGQSTRRGSWVVAMTNIIALSSLGVNPEQGPWQERGHEVQWKTSPGGSNGVSERGASRRYEEGNSPPSLHTMQKSS